jgi:hypothetical protein
VNSQISENFIACFRRLPEAVQSQARKSYKLWRVSPSHPSLHFKKIHGQENMYSVRVSKGWRALGLLEDDLITWFWIGSHAEYDKLIG